MTIDKGTKISVADKIVEVANFYLGQVEITGNKGWKDKAFQGKMQDCGWKMGDSWCAFFGELIWKEAYGISNPIWIKLDYLFSPSATATYYNFAGSEDFKVGKVPKKGALAIWQYGKSWKGHLGVVVEVSGDSENFVSAEGNTNDEGSREGYESCKRKRKTKDKFKEKGLNLLGFVYPAE